MVGLSSSRKPSAEILELLWGAVTVAHQVVQLPVKAFLFSVITALMVPSWSHVSDKVGVFPFCRRGR